MNTEKNKLELYKHNKIAYEKLVERLKVSNKTCIIHPTGTGKSYIELKLMIDNPNKKFLHITSYKSNKERFDSNVIKYTNVSQYESYIYRGLSTKNKDINKLVGYDFIILDEFHRIGAKVWGKNVNKIINNNPNAKIIGFSATPIRYLDIDENGNKRDMSDEFFENDIASEMSLKDAILNGVLPIPNYIYGIIDIVKILDENCSNFDKNAKLNIQNEFDSVRKLMNEYLISNGRYIIFCRNIEHKKEIEEKVLEEWLKDFNKVSYYDIDSRKNSNLNNIELYNFENNEDNSLKILFCIDMLNEGVHIKNINGVILCRYTSSGNIYFQQIGRALSSNFEYNIKNPLILDLVDNKENIRNIIPLIDIYKEIKNSNNYDNLCKSLFMLKYNNINIDKLLNLYTILNNNYYNRLSELDEFISENGRLPKCTNKEPIGQWLSQIKYRIRSGKITDEILISELEKRGVIFDSKYKDPIDRLPKLDEFISENGRLPNYNEGFIGRWLCHIISDIRINKITDEILISELEKRGITFDNKYKDLIDNLPELDEFIIKNDRLPNVNDKSIGRWLNRVKNRIRSGKITDEILISELEKRGVTFDSKKLIDRLPELDEFINKNGRLPDTSNGSIGTWLNRVKNRIRSGKITDEILISELEKRGVTFDSKHKNLIDRLPELDEFINKNGKLPNNSNGSIGRWLKHIKSIVRSGKITDEILILELEKRGVIF